MAAQEAYADQSIYAYEDNGDTQGYDQQAYADQSAYDETARMEYGQHQMQQPKDLHQREQATTISDVADSMRRDSAYYSTCASILVSMIDFFLHCGVAAWLTENWWGDHQPYWSFIVLALVANLFGIVAYIARHVGEPPNPHALAVVSQGPSDFSQKLADTPTECMVVILFSIVSTECMCFLTSDRRAHRTFRILDVMRSLLEGLPIMFLELAFLYRHGWAESTLVPVSFFWTIGALLLKVLRIVIILLASPDDRPAEKRLGGNLRLEDLVLLPIYTIQWIVVFVLLVFLEYASFNKRFSHDWLSRQLQALSGFNTSMAGSIAAVLSNTTLTSPSSLAYLTKLANRPTNDTSIVSCTPDAFVANAFAHFGDASNGAMQAHTKLVGGAAPTCPLEVPTLVSRALLPTGVATAESVAFAAKYLTPAAAELLSEWAWLHDRLNSCFGVGVLFFVLGCLSGLILLISYLRRQVHADAFRNSLVYNSSYVSACIAALGLVNGGWLNGLSQTKLGYSIVRRDSAFFHLLFYGFPVIGVAGATQAAFNCQHRACDVLWNGNAVEFYSAFVLLLTVPLVWWQLLSCLTATVAVRSTRARSRAQALGEKGEHELPESTEQLDLQYPPLVEAGKPDGKAASMAWLFLSCVKWLLQCILLLALFWNSPLAIRTIGGRPAYEWASPALAESIDAYLTAPISLTGGNLTLVGEIEVSYFQTGVIFWVIGMFVNVLAAGLYMAFRSTPVLRKKVEERLALTACAFTCSVVHPEAMRVLADRRSDVMALRKLGVLPALLLDAPICVLVLHWLFQHGYNGFVLLTGCASLAHALGYAARSLVVVVTERLTREVDDTPAEGSENFQRLTGGDVLALFVSLFHMGLMFALLGLYYHGWEYGYRVGFTEDEVNASASAFVVACIILSGFLVASLCTSVSFLNHFSFSHRGVAENAYFSGLVLLLSSFDVSWLALLATDAVAVREVKRAASFVSLGALFFPMLILQASCVFIASIPVTLLDEPDRDLQPEIGSGGALFTDFHILVAGEPTQNFAFGITVIVGIAKLLLMVMLQSNRKAEALRKGETVPTSPFVHTPWVLGRQWMDNRKLDGAAAAAEAKRRAALAAASGKRKPTHHMGYALDEATGNYLFDEGGNPVLGTGVSCALDEYGNYMFDDQGGYVLQDEHGAIIGEGYGENGDGYGGWISTEGGADGRSGGNVEDVTNTSRSTDTFNPEPGSAAPVSMIWATCLRRAVYMTPEGVQGVYVSLPRIPGDPSQLPYFFLQAYEVQSVKSRGGFGSRSGGGENTKVRFSYRSVDAGRYDKGYIEQHVSNDPQNAWQRLQEAQGGYGGPGAENDLAVDTYEGDAYGDAYSGGSYAHAGGYGGSSAAAASGYGYEPAYAAQAGDGAAAAYEDRALPVAQAPSAMELASPDPAAQRL